MSKTVIHTDNAPAAIGPYSQAIKAGNTLYVSGQVPINPKTGNIEAQGITAQTTQVFENLKAIISQAGGDMSSVVKCTVYLQDIKDFVAMNEVYAKYFASDYPARVAVQVAALPKNALVEIDAICVF